MWYQVSEIKLYASEMTSANLALRKTNLVSGYRNPKRIVPLLVFFLLKLTSY